MAEKNINNVRVINKHDTEANWIKATNFIPKQGELIVYDKDSTHNYERFKIGDGSTVVSSLPFADANKVDKVSGKGLSTNDYTNTEKSKLAGIAEGANKTVVDTALSTTSTNPVQNKVVNTAISNLNNLVGDTKVSTQISDAINGITHPVSSVNGKTGTVTLSASDVGAVPTTRTVNGKALSSNISLSASDVGAAASSHGTHVTFDTTAPKVAGTASVGTATTVSRSDHVHPAQTNITGNAATATKATQDASGNVITSTYATKAALNAVSSLVGDTSVSEQIEAAQIVYVGPTQPTDPNIKVWINTSEEGTGIVPVLPRVATISLPKASWTGSASPYYQTVIINTVTSATKIDLQPTVAQITSLQNADIALMAENTNGTVKVYSFGGKPSADMTMQALLTEVSYV